MPKRAIVFCIFTAAAAGAAAGMFLMAGTVIGAYNLIIVAVSAALGVAYSLTRIRLNVLLKTGAKEKFLLQAENFKTVQNLNLKQRLNNAAADKKETDRYTDYMSLTLTCILINIFAAFLFAFLLIEKAEDSVNGLVFLILLCAAAVTSFWAGAGAVRTFYKAASGNAKK